jgi:anti-anti-sigma factor
VEILTDGGVRDLRVGEHVCWLLDDPATYTGVAAELLAEGSRRGQKPVVFGPEGSAPLAQLAAGAAIAVDPHATFIGGGPLDPMILLALFREQAALAEADGYEALRVVADMDWLLPWEPTTEQIVSFEIQLDRLIRELKATIICAYRRSSFDTAAIAGALSAHPAQLGDNERPHFRFVADGPGSWRLTGEIDLGVRCALEAAVAAATAQGDCVIDISGLDFIDVAGMRAIASAGQGRAMELRGASPALRRLWELSGFSELAPTVQLGPDPAGP